MQTYIRPSYLGAKIQIVGVYGSDRHETKTDLVESSSMEIFHFSKLIVAARVAHRSHVSDGWMPSFDTPRLNS